MECLHNSSSLISYGLMCKDSRSACEDVTDVLVGDENAKL